MNQRNRRGCADWDRSGRQITNAFSPAVIAELRAKPLRYRRHRPGPITVEGSATRGDSLSSPPTRFDLLSFGWPYPAMSFQGSWSSGGPACTETRERAAGVNPISVSYPFISSARARPCLRRPTLAMWEPIRQEAPRFGRSLARPLRRRTTGGGPYPTAPRTPARPVDPWH